MEEKTGSEKEEMGTGLRRVCFTENRKDRDSQGIGYIDFCSLWIFS